LLDLKRIRDDPDGVRAALQRRDPELPATLEQVLAKDRSWRAATTASESLRAAQREHSEGVAAAKRAGADVAEELVRLKQMSAEVKDLTEQARAGQEELQAALALLPNLPDPSAAEGPDDDLVREVGEIPSFAFEPRDHLELAGSMIDMDRAANLSGSRFAYLKGDLVMLELALVAWALEKLRGHGFEPVIPPVLVRERALYGTGFLPDTEQQIYRLAEDELYLAGTSEVALASLHDGEVLDGEQLPLRYAGFSPCFRREAGAAGKDTRGIFRVHQFDKVEMFSFVAPEVSAEEHERILAIEEEILQELALPYRVVNIAVGDLGSSAAKKYDCEAWLPSQGRYRELTSCSNTTDYQARRLNIRVRRARSAPTERAAGEGAPEPSTGQRTHTPHTLNGTAVAVGRTLIALLENGQQADGSVELPAALVAYGAPPRLAAQEPGS
jgi:seryl-tRNA synthetase